jgi:site-specific DNA-methyltransferase (adenine-specific)
MKQIPDGSIDMVLCDLPYGTTQNKWDNIIPFDLMWEQLNRIVKPNKAILLFGSEPFSSFLRTSNIKFYKYDWVWNKILKTGHLNSKKMPMVQHEIISVFGKGRIDYYPIMEDGIPEHARGDKRKKGNMDSDNYGKQRVDFIDKTGNTKKFPSSLSLVFQKPHPSKCVHPTQKPTELIEYLIKTYTNENETVLDFTMGSGTTGVACVNTNRKFIGIEKDENYFNIAQNRIMETITKGCA